MYIVVLQTEQQVRQSNSEQSTSAQQATHIRSWALSVTLSESETVQFDVASGH